MRTSTTGKKKFTSIIGTILMAFVFASVIDGLSIGPAFGQDRAIPARDRYERRGHDRGRWDRDRWDRDRWTAAGGNTAGDIIGLMPTGYRFMRLRRSTFLLRPRRRASVSSFPLSLSVKGNLFGHSLRSRKTVSRTLARRPIQTISRTTS